MLYKFLPRKLLNPCCVKEVMEKATFAAGCFWGVEAAFRKHKGIHKTTVGYTAGKTKNPNYKQVCTDTTGHAEAVQIEYEEKKISYEKLLEIFWSCHDPTTMNRQGPDIGTQYRSAIFYHTEKQKELPNYRYYYLWELIKLILKQWTRPQK